MPNPSTGTSGARRAEGDGLSNGTVVTFAIGLFIVLVAGLVVGPWAKSYVAGAFAAYFLTTVYDLVVDRLGYREALLARARDAEDPVPAGD